MVGNGVFLKVSGYQPGCTFHVLILDEQHRRVSYSCQWYLMGSTHRWLCAMFPRLLTTMSKTLTSITKLATECEHGL